MVEEEINVPKVRIIDEIREHVKQEMINKGEDIDSDYDDDFDDVVSDIREDEPYLLENIDDAKARSRLVDKIVNELSWGDKNVAIW